MAEAALETHDRRTTDDSIVDFVDRDPFPFYDRMRDARSPIWDKKAQAWLLLDFDQCAAVQRDESRFVVVYADADETLRTIKGGGANIILSQGREHDLLRRFHLKLLSPASVERYRGVHIAPIVERVIDRLAHRDRAELSRDFSEQIPPRVICSLLGMDYDDDAMIARILVLNEHIVQYIASGYRGDGLREQALDASRELNTMLLPAIRARRDDPREDFISRVWTEAEAAGIPMDEAAALGLCRELYFAGSDTTVHGLNNALYLLLTDPEAMARARSDDEKAMRPVIEESLRLYDVVQFRHRRCTVETAIGDVTVKPGEIVIMAHAAANRDPAKYGCPHQAQYDRPVPTDHLAFGKGNRACVGSQLARVETRDALSALLHRYPDLRLDPVAEQPYFRGIYMRSMGPLNVVLGRRA
ncbi:MAG: hypothetical protein JWR77_2138 [Rhizorhabdus sp.]|nr:hypothetical protein [Rhizorhabdus sp.]